MVYILALVALVAGVGIGYLVRKIQVSQLIGSAEVKVQKMLDDAQAKEKEILLAAKEKALELTEEVKKQEDEVRQQLLRAEQRYEKKEQELERKGNALEEERKEVVKNNEGVKKLQEEMREFKQKQIARLEEIAQMNQEQAKALLLETTEKTIKEEMVALTRKVVANAREDADKKAREIVAHAIERCASEVTAETTTTVVHIPSEEMKGRIIGKEGRNIRSFEQMMGVEILIDDSPDTVIISGFNSIRRYIAKLTLEKLIQDGRIHPARIEEAYEKSKQEVGEMIKQAGEEAVYELGITSFPPKLIQLIGRL